MKDLYAVYTLCKRQVYTQHTKNSDNMLGCEYDGSNDPSAGSPTETLLRLLLPLDDKVWGTSQRSTAADRPGTPLRTPHRTVQSVGATGGVYKGQGRNQRKLMTCAY